MAYLLRKHTDHSVETTEVAGPLLHLGRGANAELRLDDKAVNLEHAQVRQQPNGQYLLTDVNSVTGTYVNGKRVQTAILHDGDQIVIGSFLLTVSLPDPSVPLSIDIHQRDLIQAPEVNYAAAYALDRRWLNKPLLALLLLLAGAGGARYVLRTGKTEMFRPGSVSMAHALFTNQCSRCHDPWGGPSEEKCQDCHAGPIHNIEQESPPSCLSCHAEHRGRPILTQVVNGYCIECHKGLKTKSGTPSWFDTTISDFAQSHPQFAITVYNDSSPQRPRLDTNEARQADRAKITFGHDVHLPGGEKKDDKVRKDGKPLTCAECHVPAVDGRRMAPVTYKDNCQGCHKEMDLKFDCEFPEAVVPHGPPADVRTYLVATYAAALGRVALSRPQWGRIVQPGEPLKDPGVVQRIRDAEAHLYSKGNNVGCKRCHEVLCDEKPCYQADKRPQTPKTTALTLRSLPTITKPAIPTEWLPHAQFSHRTHRSLICASCHGEVDKSSQTRDVLLPKIEVCRECHRADTPGAVAQQAHASTDCVTCHRYHDKSKDVDLNRPFTVESLLRDAK